MKNKTLTVMVGAALLLGSGAASAQLGGFAKSLLGNTGSGGSVTADQIVSKYIGGAHSVMLADANMLAAVGLKDEAEKASVQAKNLTEGATKNSLEDASKVQTDSSKALEEKIQGKKVVMDAASKKQFGDGMSELAKGVIQYVSMSKDVAGFKPSITSLGGGAMSALYVVKNLPDSVQNLAHTLKMAMDFSKANGIPVPKEANDATSML